MKRSKAEHEARARKQAAGMELFKAAAPLLFGEGLSEAEAAKRIGVTRRQVCSAVQIWENLTGNSYREFRVETQARRVIDWHRQGDKGPFPVRLNSGYNRVSVAISCYEKGVLVLYDTKRPFPDGAVRKSCRYAENLEPEDRRRYLELVDYHAAAHRARAALDAQRTRVSEEAIQYGTDGDGREVVKFRKRRNAKHENVKK